jgi:hypothetical protein
MKIFVTLCLVLFLGSCHNGKDGGWDYRIPHSLDFSPDFPEGTPPEYIKGYQDGCESASNTYSGVFYKHMRLFDFTLDPKLVDNKVYYQIWNDAFVYCSVFWEGLNNDPL